MKLLWPVWVRGLCRMTQKALVVIGVLALALACFWLKKESDWESGATLNDAEAFHHGTLGLETLPLKYLLVLDEVSGDQFSFRNGLNRPFTEAYGFIVPPAPAGKSVCDAQTPDEARAFLPVGFSITHRLPLSATPSPVQFAGLTCALCHSSRIHTADGKVDRIVIGAGSTSLDLISWVDGFQNAILDPHLTADRIFEAYDKKCGPPKGFVAASIERPVERIFINGWISGLRATILQNITQYDLPYSGLDLNDAAKIYAGPSRTRPFRSVVRTALNFPGQNNFALSKVPAVFDQQAKPRSQYDGSIDDRVVRSLVAAYTSGSSVEALAQPEVVHNIHAAADFTRDAGNRPNTQAGFEVPAYPAVFPGRYDPARAKRGLEVYKQYCQSCHGYRPLGDGDEKPYDTAVQCPNKYWCLGENVPLKEIGTDPSRIEFRYSDILPDAIQLSFVGGGEDLERQRQTLAKVEADALEQGKGALAGFWKNLTGDGGSSVPGLGSLDHAHLLYPGGHPFFIKPGVVHNGVPLGYLNSPLPRAWLRAPYFHNASVPTMRQLIGLDPRPEVFCRGDNPYDPDALGITAPAPVNGTCPPEFGFKYDTRLPGNSNAGHLYPWAYPTPAQRQQLADLLEYLKSL
jgi:hypothetical protein